MNNNIQCSIESSTTKIELNSAVDGVFLVPELEGLVGLPEIRTTSGVNAGYDGGWTSAQHYDARLISIRGVIASPDISKVEDKRRAIASLLGQGRKEQLTLRFTTEAGNAYAISVRTISCEMALQRMLTTQEFLIQLRADDPLIYDDGTTGGIAAILQPQRALGGFEIDFELPLAIGGGAEDTVVDNGNETVYPVIKLYGALHSPTVVNRTTNQQMQILADLQYSIDWHTYRSATGDYILVNGGLDGAPMTLSQLLGNAEQTTYSGKNLLPSINTTRTRNGVTFTHNEDGSISLSGTASADTAYPINVNSTGNSRNVALSAGNYIVSGGSATSPTTVYMQAYYGTTGGADRYTASTFTLEADGTMGAYIYVKSGVNTSGKTIYPMVEKSSTATDYEPYVGGIPAPNSEFPQPISVVTGENVVKVTGKNLLAPFDWTRLSAGITFTASNGGITVSGTATSNAFMCGNAEMVDNFPHAILPAGTYTLSAKDGIVGAQFRIVDVSGYTVLAYCDAQPTTFTLTEQHEVGINARVSSGTVITTPVTIYPQLELGSTATAYEPYQGQSYEVDLSLASKNMLNPAWMTAGFISVNGDITPNQSQGESACQYFIPVEPNTEYTFEIFATSDAYPTWIGIGEYSTASESGFTTRVTNTSDNYLTFTTASNAHFIRPSARNLQHATKYMLSKGSRTTYEPYFELAKVGNYQDRIYKDDGKWYIRRAVGKVVFDGSNDESWWLQSGTTNQMRAPISGTFAGAPLMSDYFHNSSSESELGAMYIYLAGYIRAVSNQTSVNDFKTWLSTHPTTVYYALATPTTTEITDETLLLQLNFLASLYEGVNNISLVGTGVQGEMVIRYATDYTVNQDIITIDSQARTITLNGQDIYHLKTSESEFLVLAPGENKLYLTSEVSDDSGYAEVKFKQGYLSI